MMIGIRRLSFLLLLAAGAAPASAQSLDLQLGDRAAEASVGWSTGPQSHGVETFFSVSLDGRTDVGLGIRHYTYTFDDGTKSAFKEYAPFARFFVLKQEDGGAPVSIALSGQVFVDDYGTKDSGHYVQLGSTVYKSVKLSERFRMQPFLGFAYVAESYTFGGAPAARAEYLTRDLGVQFTTRTDRQWFVRVTLVEQAFRQETYRGAQASIVRRF